jgi:hypothetical protein
VLLSAYLACAGIVFVGCGGAVFQGDDDDDTGGEGATSGKGGNSGSGGSGGGSGSGGTAGKGSGGGGGSAGGGGGTGGSAGRGGQGAGGTVAGSGGSGNTGNEGGTAGMGASGGSAGSGNTGNAGSTGGSSGSGMGGSSGGANTEQWAADYDQSCDFDSHCTLVQQGDKCACPTCDTGAVSSSEAEHYQSDWESIMCPPGEPGVCPAIACAEQLATCTESGKCYAREPTYIDAANYPKTCEQPSDCHVIFTGEVCSSCQCATAAVNRDGYEQYREDVESVDCSPGPNVCDCAPQLEVTCLVDVTGEGKGQCVMAHLVPLPE